jgi:hypothetical protein
MDTLFWTRYNPKIVPTFTTKKFFGNYLYKLVVYSPGGRLIDSKGIMLAELEHRKMVNRNVNVGYWGYRNNKELDNANIELLEVLRTTKKSNTAGIKFRVEEPRIQIYAESVDQLVDLANGPLKDYSKYVESIAGPEDQAAETALNSNAIIRKRDNGFTYKIVLRDGRYTEDVKRSLLDYLNNMPEDMISVPGGTKDMLSRSNGFMWNCYFYTNDMSLLTFVNLIAPGIVSNTHELIVRTNK